MFRHNIDDDIDKAISKHEQGNAKVLGNKEKKDKDIRKSQIMMDKYNVIRIRELRKMLKEVVTLDIPMLTIISLVLNALCLIMIIYVVRLVS